MLYTHIHADVSRNIMTTSINERTRFFIKILFLRFIWKGWCRLCMRGALETETDCHILTPNSSDHSSTSFSFLLGCSTVGQWGPTPSVWSWFSLQGHPISNYDCNSLHRTGCLELQLTQVVCGIWLYNCLTHTCFLWAYVSAPNSTTSTSQGDIPTSSIRCTSFFRLFTQVHLLIDCSVEGQHATKTRK